MKLKVSKHTSAKTKNRLKKKIRIRKTVKGTSERPRLCVFRSAKHIYAQIINDDLAQTVLTVSSLSLETKVTGKELAKYETDWHSLFVSPDGKTVASNKNLYELNTGKKILDFDEGKPVAFSPDGKSVALISKDTVLIRSNWGK